jgi:hypothetical protein
MTIGNDLGSELLDRNEVARFTSSSEPDHRLPRSGSRRPDLNSGRQSVGGTAGREHCTAAADWKHLELGDGENGCGGTGPLWPNPDGGPAKSGPPPSDNSSDSSTPYNRTLM